MKSVKQKSKINSYDNDFDLSFFGLYRAVIVDNKDPEQLFRVQVRVFELYQDLELTTLPWAWPCFSYGGGGLPGYGESYVPPIGSTVWVGFEHGNVDKPVYIGTFYGKPLGFSEAPIEFREKSLAPAHADPEPLINSPAFANPVYPNNHGIRTKNGIVIEWDDTPGEERIHLFHPSGSHMEFRKGGQVVLHVIGDYHVVVDGDKRELIKGNHFRDVLQNQTFTVGINQTETITGNRTTTVVLNDTLVIQGLRTKTVTGVVTNIYQGALTQTVTGPVINNFLNTYTKNVTGVAIDTYLSTYTMNVTLAMVVNALLSYTRNSITQNINGTGPYTLTNSGPGDIDILQTSSTAPRNILIKSSFGNVNISP